METNSEQEKSITDRFAVLLPYLFITLLTIWVVIEWFGLINLVTYSLPLNGPKFAQIVSGVGSLILSFGLLLLYSRQTQIQQDQTRIQQDQTKIQENQTSLMEKQFTPYLTGEVTYLNISSAQFQIRNTGNGPAYNVEAEWEVAGEKRTWNIPSLSPGENYGFPVIVDDGEWILNMKKIEKYLEENNASSVINYEITFENRFREEDEFEGSVDFGVLIARSESDEIWDNSPLEEISRGVNKIQRDMKKSVGMNGMEIELLNGNNEFSK